MIVVFPLVSLQNHKTHGGGGGPSPRKNRGVSRTHFSARAPAAHSAPGAGGIPPGSPWA